MKGTAGTQKAYKMKEGRFSDRDSDNKGRVKKITKQAMDLIDVRRLLNLKGFHKKVDVIYRIVGLVSKRR